MPAFSITVRGQKVVKGLFFNARNAAANFPGDALDPIDAYLRQRMRRAFNTEGKAIGEQWARLTPEYARFKRRRYGGFLPILVATGGMREGFISEGGDHIARRVGSAVEIGAGGRSGWLGDIHQRRGAGKSKVRRRFIRLSAEDAVAIAKIGAEAVNKAAREGGA